MVIDVIEMPAERVYKVRLDGLTLGGYIKQDEEEDRWAVYRPNPTGLVRQMKVKPVSREAAGLLLVYEHLQEERRMLTTRESAHRGAQREAEDERASAERDEVSDE